MRIFLTDANGFIGGTVASALIADGHTVGGLVRDQGNASAVAAHGIEAVIGALDDTALLQTEARASDAVVNDVAAHRGGVECRSERRGRPCFHPGYIAGRSGGMASGKHAER